MKDLQAERSRQEMKSSLYCSSCYKFSLLESSGLNRYTFIPFYLYMKHTFGQPVVKCFKCLYSISLTQQHKENDLIFNLNIVKQAKRFGTLFVSFYLLFCFASYTEPCECCKSLPKWSWASLSLCLCSCAFTFLCLCQCA